MESRLVAEKSPVDAVTFRSGKDSGPYNPFAEVAAMTGNVLDSAPLDFARERQSEERFEEFQSTGPAREEGRTRFVARYSAVPTVVVEEVEEVMNSVLSLGERQRVAAVYLVVRIARLGQRNLVSLLSAEAVEAVVVQAQRSAVVEREEDSLPEPAMLAEPGWVGEGG